MPFPQTCHVSPGSWTELLLCPDNHVGARMPRPNPTLNRTAGTWLVLYRRQRGPPVSLIAESPSQLPLLAKRCAKENCEALVSQADPNLNSFRGAITSLASSLNVPAVYSFTAFALDGGLISYSADYAQLRRRATSYVDKILKGAKPGDLPVERPTKFELIVNMKTAKALGIKIPQSILVHAD